MILKKRLIRAIISVLLIPYICTCYMLLSAFIKKVYNLRYLAAFFLRYKKKNNAQTIVIAMA